MACSKKIDNNVKELDSETILMTLDQIGQTIDVMTSVVGRLRGYLTEHSAAEIDSGLKQINRAIEEFEAQGLPASSPYLDVSTTSTTRH